MATQDHNIQYDLLFFNQFYDYAYPNSTKEQKDHYNLIVENGEIQISTLIENAIAKMAGLKRLSASAMDLNDGSEVKTAVSSFRNNHIAKGTWTNSYEIRNVKAKTGPIRFVGYNKLASKFEYYFVPNYMFADLKSTLTLPIETVSGVYTEPKFTGVRSGQSKWHKFMVPSFEELCKL